MKLITKLLICCLTFILISCVTTNGHVMNPPIYNTNKFITDSNNVSIENYDFSRQDNSTLIIFSYDFTGVMGDRTEGIRIIEQNFSDKKSNFSKFVDVFPVDAVKTLATYRGFKVKVETQTTHGKIIYAGHIIVNLSDINTKPEAIVVDKQQVIIELLKKNNADLNENQIHKSLFTADLFYSK